MPSEEAKRNYPGKWKQAQQSAEEVYGLEVGTEAHGLKSERLFIELGGGGVDSKPDSAQGEGMKCPECGLELDSNDLISWCCSGHVYRIITSEENETPDSAQGGKEGEA